MRFALDIWASDMATDPLYGLVGRVPQSFAVMMESEISRQVFNLHGIILLLRNYQNPAW